MCWEVAAFLTFKKKKKNPTTPQTLQLIYDASFLAFGK